MAAHNVPAMLMVAAIGALVTSVLALVPALHVYNVAAFVILATSVLGDFLPPDMLAMLFLGMVASYSMLNTIPSIFLAAPDDSTVFVVLPGQKYLLQRRGYEAAVLTGVGGLGGIAVLALLTPIAASLLPTLRAAQDPALRDIYVAKAAERTGVRRETLEAELARLDRAEPRRAPTPEPMSRPEAPSVIARMGAERSLLLFLIRDRERIEWVTERLGADEFRDPSYRAIFTALVADHELDHPPQGMDPVAAHHLDELLGDPELYAPVIRSDLSLGQINGLINDLGGNPYQQLDQPVRHLQALRGALDGLIGLGKYGI